jgi:polysaccharide pyruvyl transferase WcaK-like protein
VLGLRFHSLIAAAAAGAPFLAFAHEAKLAAVARWLGQPVVDPAAPPCVLTEALLAALDGPPPTADVVRRERERAEDGFRLLRVLLARGRSEEAPAVDGLALRPEEWL